MRKELKLDEAASYQAGKTTASILAPTEAYNPQAAESSDMGPEERLLAQAMREPPVP